MEKTAQRKTYRDPALNKIVQEKALWNRQVSSLINDIIHFKKSMNGWPSKFYKERTRITQPVPIDLAGILNKISTEFQEIATSGNGILQEQRDFANAHVKRHSERTLNKLEQEHGPETPPPAPGAPKPPAPNLTQQLGKGASQEQLELIKVASDLEHKYASNPFTRFITRLFTPKIGFGEGARIRRLRMEMLDYTVKSYKAIKQLHKEIVKSGKGSIIQSHKMMAPVWNNWNNVNRLFSTYRIIRKDEVVSDAGGPISNPTADADKGKGKGKGQSATPPPDDQSVARAAQLNTLLQDFYGASGALGKVTNPTFHELHSLVEQVLAAPQDQKVTALLSSNLDEVYQRALQETNNELGTNSPSFKEIAATSPFENVGPKNAQRQLGKLRHSLLPGATSGQRLEAYNLLNQIRSDMLKLMDLLEAGFDVQQLTAAIGTVQREMVTLRTMMRALYYTVKPDEASSPFF